MNSPDYAPGREAYILRVALHDLGMLATEYQTIPPRAAHQVKSDRLHTAQQAIGEFANEVIDEIARDQLTWELASKSLYEGLPQPRRFEVAPSPSDMVHHKYRELKQAHATASESRPLEGVVIYGGLLAQLHPAELAMGAATAANKGVLQRLHRSAVYFQSGIVAVKNAQLAGQLSTTNAAIASVTPHEGYLSAQEASPHYFWYQPQSTTLDSQYGVLTTALGSILRRQSGNEIAFRDDSLREILGRVDQAVARAALWLAFNPDGLPVLPPEAL